MSLLVCPLMHYFVVLRLMQIVFNHLLRVGEHVLDTLGHEVSHGDAFLLWVI